MEKIDVTVVIPALNSENTISNCLNSIRSNETKYNYEIIVVDAGSHDHTVEKAREWVAAKSGFARHDAPGVQSRWRDATVTSCVLEPTLSRMSEGTVVREDGSPVDF